MEGCRWRWPGTTQQPWAAKVESDLGHGVFVPTTADRRRSLSDLIAKYIADYLPVKARNRDRDKHTSLLTWWRDEFGYVTQDKLKPETIAEARGKLAKRTTRAGEPVSGATINRYLAAISAVCKWGWREIGWLPANPVLAVSKASENEGVIRFLSDDERKALFKSCREHPNPNIRVAVLLALATGARYGNIRFLRWEEVDFDRWPLRFETTKSGKPRYVPVVGAAQAALRAHFEADPTQEGWVFKGHRDNAPADIVRLWRQVRAMAGLDDVRFHDLRHTTASYLTQSGAGLAQVADALGLTKLAQSARKRWGQSPLVISVPHTSNTHGLGLGATAARTLSPTGCPSGYTGFAARYDESTDGDHLQLSFIDVRDIHLR